MLPKFNIELVSKIILWTALWAMLVLLSSPLFAAENERIQTSKSISYSKTQQLDKPARDSQLKTAEANTVSVSDTQAPRIESTAQAVHIVTISESWSTDYAIYDASTELISDFDYDGFYHRLKVDVDVDTVFDSAYVYVKLFLSYEGGPWIQYASSDNFHINGDSELDSFSIETELDDGFPTGYYDVRIEVYDADLDLWLLSYGPYDDASLSALPLEDSYQDEDNTVVVYPVETEIVVAGHGGSLSWLLLVPVLLVMARQISSR